MRYVQFGRTGVRVSAFCIGTGNFGRYVDVADSIRVMRFALDEGVNFIDTADIYNDGVSENYVGKAIDGRRDEVFLASKAFNRMGTGPNDWGCSRRHLMSAVEDSLRRLGTDWIDLYQMHQFDETTPLDETLRALDDLVRQGKVRYLGSSNYPAWRHVDALRISDELGMNRLVSEQSQYNVLRRRPEEAQLPVCRKYGSAFLGYSPLAAGWLSGKFRRDGTDLGTNTKSADHGPDRLGSERGDHWLDLIERLVAIADDKGCTLPELALAWTMRDSVVIPILGPRTEDHIRGAIRALDVEITADDERRMDEIVPPATNAR